MRNNRRNRSTDIGVLLLIYHLMQNELVPPVTLGAIIIQILIYIDIIKFPFKTKQICISGENILYKKNYSLLLTSTLEHLDDMHLYYNMTSFTLKGRYLEKKYGSFNFAILLLILIYLSSGFYVLISYFMYIYNDEDYIHLMQCAAGFSGVLFALKVIITREKPSNYYLMGISFPAWVSSWAELILIAVMVPNSSFRGHLAGILAGLVYTNTPIGSIIDQVLYFLTGNKVYHNFNRTSLWRFFSRSSNQSSYEGYSRGQQSYSSYTQNNYRFNSETNSNYNSQSSTRQRGVPPRYGFIYGNNEADDWEYDYYER